MYENNYPNDYNTNKDVYTDRNVIDGTAKEVKAEHSNISGQNTTGYNNANASAHGSSYQYGGNANGSTISNYGTGYYSGSSYNPGNGAGKPPKKEKKAKSGGGYFKKVLVAVSLGLFFGICAGLGFFAVDTATGFLNPRETETASDSIKQTDEIADALAEAGIIDNMGNDSTVGPTVVADVSNVVTEVMPAIVSINNTYTETMMSYFGQSLEGEATAVGSGIIVGESDTELVLVTNYHVVQDADKLSVQFVDGSEAEAQMKGSDSSMDLAVIAVSLDDISSVTKDAIAVATLGDSDSLAVGEPAIAIGNALGYGQSVTVGVISALDRAINLTDGSNNSDASFIQTDAAINPGNSGGALLNLKGEVIGINSNKIGGSVVEGMGYAIPISAAKPIMEDLMLKETRAKVSEDNKGYLGISQLTVVDEMAEAYGMPKGVYVSQVYEGTAAEAAGIVKGNIITEFDGNKINSTEDMLRVLQYYSAGDTVEVTIMQGSPLGWESKTVTLTLGTKFADYENNK